MTSDNVGEPGSVWRGDVVSAYPPLEKIRLNENYGKRRPVKPAWGGRHGARVKGSVNWEPDVLAWRVTFPYLIGYETTARASELYYVWRTAILEYMEHDRTVRERQKLENFRAIRAVK